MTSGRTYLERFRLTGRHAVVTGGGRGIGLACAEALAEAGAEICITDSDPEIAKAGVAALKAKGSSARSEVFDVTDPTKVNEVAGRLNRDWGLVDVLVCNAGIARSDTPAETVSDEHWRNVIDVNLNGVFWCCRAFGGKCLR
ncbi:MAG: SDR family NAD(P)-dependent oxidoreductase, partial [Alphaproteobacteria bacterium]|nr:SDR family NAD(P)-dependent oxidoreductase [Alphaproteobacteria bacterium]